MELHHSKHHNTYVNSYNEASEKLLTAEASDDVRAKIALQPLINFHGGGHINHSLFWENLAPKSQGGGTPPSGSLATAIDDTYGSLEELKKKFNAALAGIQGSGWAWLVKDTQTGNISIQTYANQDPVVGRYQPLLGVDAWEHAVSGERNITREPMELTAIVLPSVPEPQSRILYRHLGCDQLEGGREEVR